MNFRVFDSIPGLYPSRDNQKCLQTFAKRSLGQWVWGHCSNSILMAISADDFTRLCADVGKQRLMVTKLVPGSVGF